MAVEGWRRGRRVRACFSALKQRRTHGLERGDGVIHAKLSPATGILLVEESR